jgi:putative ABC transport system permease protein
VSTFLKLLTYVRRTILRARLRSTLTVLGTALALALFTFVRMLEGGVDRMNEAADQPVLVVFQSSRFCPLTSQLPERYMQELERLPGVEAVLPTLIYINSCRANLDLVTLHGVDTERLEEIHELTLLEGDLHAWKRRGDGALVGKRLAERRKLKPGDRLQLSGVDVEVGGIVTGPGAGVDNVAFVRLDQLQQVRKQRGIATEFFVRLAPGTDAAALAGEIDRMFKSAEQPTDTKPMQAFVAGAVGEVAEVVDFARLLGYLAVVVVVLILANTVSISAHSREQELGVLETVGVGRPTLAALILTESLALGLAGGVLGAGAVVALLTFFPLTLGVEGWGIDVLPEGRLVVGALGVAAIVGLLAAVAPALGVLRRPLALAVKAE